MEIVCVKCWKESFWCRCENDKPQRAKITIPCYMQIGKKNHLNLNTYRNLHYQSLNTGKIKFKKLVKDDVEKLPVFEKPVSLSYKYLLRDRRLVDVGNIHSVVEKYFLDALVEFKRIKDDNYNYVIGSSYIFGGIDKDNPRCEITIEEVD